MDPNKGLFDDEDEQEYNPNPPADVGTGAADQYQQPNNMDQQQVPPNPYAQDQHQQQQYDYNQQNQDYQQVQQQPPAQNNNLFDDGDGDGEYQPPAQQPDYSQQTAATDQNQAAAIPPSDQGVHPNPYGQDQQQNNFAPIGFGAERASLMQEQNYDVPDTTNNVAPSAANTHEEEKKEEKVDINLKEQADQAKNKLLQEINALKDTPEMAAASGAVDAADEAQADNPFDVKDPVAVGSVIKYTVAGKDSQGDFTTQRRYNEFLSLRKIFTDRWPGCYIPAIPEKVTVNINVDKMSIQGNKDANFVEERRSLLQRFIREIAMFEYLVESKEFQIFARGAGEVTKTLEDLPKQSPTEILEKYRLNFSIDEDQANSEIARYKEKINIFTVYLRKALAQLEKQSEAFHKYSNAQHDSMKHYQRIYYNFLKFEDDALDFFAEQDRTQRLLTNPSQPDLPGDIVANINSWKRSFKDVWVWLKGECLEVKGMMDAMAGRDKMILMQQKCEEKKRDKQTELDKMSMGKTTLKSFFKSKSTIEKDILNYQADIEQLNIDIEEYRKLVSFITIYQGQLAIEKFKRIKVTQYMKVLNSFSVKEISNAHLQATLAHQILVLSEQANQTQ